MESRDVYDLIGQSIASSFNSRDYMLAGITKSLELSIAIIVNKGKIEIERQNHEIRANAFPQPIDTNNEFIETLLALINKQYMDDIDRFWYRLYFGDEIKS